MRTRLTSHGLRRTMTDLLRRARVDPVVAKGVIGHATDAMREHDSTLGVDEAREAADRVAALVFVEAPAGELDERAVGVSHESTGLGGGFASPGRARKRPVGLRQPAGMVALSSGAGDEIRTRDVNLGKAPGKPVSVCNH